ncbi:hypothetical protein BLNAU_6904 [Blattamonas nauphoetae]|uniref:Uncharacterized protein n=1 Tax=Blattamonas nauphoetae TaxID=2049346 RepID=A0ABQ9Y385_9EUKA|nr:hypothetical protein BLNAU_6904 [Blattamonas nauphoetae]
MIIFPVHFALNNFQAVLSSVILMMVLSVSEGRQRPPSDLIPSLIALSSHADSSLSTPAAHSIGLLCGGSLSRMEVEGVLSSGIVERLCTRLEFENKSVDLHPTLLILDRLCSGLKKIISSHSQSSQSAPSILRGTQEQNETFSVSDRFSLVSRCGFALSRIEKAVVSFGRSLEDVEDDEKARNLQDRVGGIVFRYFSSSIPSPPQKDIGEIGIDLAAVRREMDETMRQMEEMRKMNEHLIEKGRQQEEKEKEKRKRKEEEERKSLFREGAAAIEVFQQDKFTLVGNVFTSKQSQNFHLLSQSFGAVVARITFIIRVIHGEFDFGLISTDQTEQAKTAKNVFWCFKGGAGWLAHSSHQLVYQNGNLSHKATACKKGEVGQRVVMEADGREGKRTLRMSQDGETQPVFFSNIPVPFRFVVHPYLTGNSVEIVSSEVLREAEMTGGSLEVVMD